MIELILMINHKFNKNKIKKEIKKFLIFKLKVVIFT